MIIRGELIRLNNIQYRLLKLAAQTFGVKLSDGHLFKSKFVTKIQTFLKMVFFNSMGPRKKTNVKDLKLQKFPKTILPPFI